MLNASDVKTLREKGMSNMDILKNMGRVVPSAQRSYESILNNKNIPEWQKETKVGKMLDMKVPKNAPSGMGYMAVSGMDAAQKSYDQKQEELKIQDQADQSMSDGNFSAKGIASSVVGGAKGLAQFATDPLRLALSAGENAIASTADALLPGQPITKFGSKYVPGFNDINSSQQDGSVAQRFYQSFPTALGVASAPIIGPAAPYLAAGVRGIQSKFIDPATGMGDGDSANAALDAAKEFAMFKIFGGAKGKYSSKVVPGITGPGTAIYSGSLNAAISQMLSPEDSRSISDKAEEIVASGLLTAPFGYINKKAGNPLQRMQGKEVPPEVPPKSPPSGPGGVPTEAGMVARDVGSSMLTRATGMSPDARQTAIQHPEMLTEFQRGQQSPKTVMEDFSSSFKAMEENVSELGSGYKNIRNSGKIVKQSVSSFEKILESEGIRFVKEGRARTKFDGSSYQPGHIEIGTTKLHPTEIQFLEKFMQDHGSLPQQRVDAYLNGRAKITELANFFSKDVPSQGTHLRALADKMYAEYSKAKDYPNMNDLKMLDEKFAPEKKFFDQIKKDFFERNSNTGELELSDKGISRLLNAEKGTKLRLLEKLEEASPGITRKLRVLNAFNEIMTENKPGTYVKAGLTLAGFTGGPLGALGGFAIGSLLTSPTLLTLILKEYGRRTGKSLDGVIYKMERGAKLTPEETNGVKGMVKEFEKRANAQKPQKPSEGQQQGKSVDPSPTILPEPPNPVK